MSDRARKQALAETMAGTKINVALTEEQRRPHRDGSLHIHIEGRPGEDVIAHVDRRRR